jgi:SAM-dependent methyltransferase
VKRSHLLVAEHHRGPKLDFHGQDTLYATHGLHAYAAKCPPQLVRYALQYYAPRNGKVLDPMVGSGTTLVESRLRARHAVGCDIDPLAVLIARVKSRPLSDETIAGPFAQMMARVDGDIGCLSKRRVPTEVAARSAPPEFHNRDYWFAPEVAAELSLLAFHLQDTAMPIAVREFLWVAFSSVILARSSVANARDIIHSRHHFFLHEEVPLVAQRFRQRVEKMRRQMKAFTDACADQMDLQVTAQLADARALPLRSESIDLVFTSPPYATALDYPRAHFLAVPWMQPVLGLDLPSYLARTPGYIGSERGRLPKAFAIDPALAAFEQTVNVLNALKTSSIAQAKLAQRYFVDMKRALQEMARVLKPGGHTIIVVCPSHIRKIEVPTHRVLGELGRDCGLAPERCYERTISERRRILPYLKEAFGNRMDTEYVLVLKKR